MFQGHSSGTYPPGATLTDRRRATAAVRESKAKHVIVELPGCGSYKVGHQDRMT